MTMALLPAGCLRKNLSKKNGAAYLSCSRQPRLQNALGCRDLKFADKDGKRIVTVTVFNEAQKKWIEENSLRKIESELQKLVSSKLVQVLIDTEPQDNTERIIYTAAEKAQDLMSKNEEFRTLVGSLELDV